MAYVTAGNVLTAAQVNALADRLQLVRKPSAQNIISSTTLTNDTDLKFTAVAGQTYQFDLALIFSAVTSAIDAKVGFSFPSGTLSFQRISMDPAVASGVIGSGIWDAFSSATSGTSALSCGVASADTSVRVSGSFSCTVGGTVQFMWAQNTLTASNLTLQAGSFLQAIRVAV